ncbi:molybdopterin-guanine dinucleotide biosynthesis protein A [Pelomonas saccharophila]|uniref:Molybdenum cofactor guanylyltransferase n=1 Tax=Roseateles saccharophilus TaxID=304 RepID=A0ABU1YR90_ROSSA|nr:molybdenum cofactor guanylyltransferase MobA [Roseateles saccharophilus]MDR7271380.1 molybdopterin-guanine dinucleotide biosynthesis protein A [Roseateles saccharophilus]
MAEVHALVLAGGRGSRMGGVDKGLQLLDGRPLVTHVIERLGPQADMLRISANRNLDIYAALGREVLTDPPGLEFAGPLAGMLAGLEALPDDAWLLTAPCDCPRLPLDLAQRLLAVAQAHGLAFAQAAREHPTHALLHARLRQPLRAHLATAGRAVLGWMRSRPHGVAHFDDEAAFANLNHLTDL